MHAKTLILALLLAGCSDNDFTRANSVDVFQQAPSNEVDILWIIDNSVSMRNEQEAVAAGAQDFIGRLTTTDIDFHMGVITTDVSTSNPDAGALLGTPSVLTPSTPSYVQEFQERVLQGTEGDDQERGLQAAITALTAPMTNTRNVGFLRDEAMLSIIVLSDENDCSDFGALGANSTGEDCYSEYDKLTPVADLVRELRELKEDSNRVIFSGIVGPDASENCDDSVPGKRYFTAIDMLNGVTGDICQTDYGAVMDALGEITSGILTSFSLDYVPDPETIVVTVDIPGQGAHEVPQDGNNGWTYNDDPTSPAIDFHGTEIPPRGSEITVEYTIAADVQSGDDTGA